MQNELFREDNTLGYSETEREAINAEWSSLCEREQLEHGADDYWSAAKEFADKVAKR